MELRYPEDSEIVGVACNSLINGTAAIKGEKCHEILKSYTFLGLNFELISNTV